MSSSFFVHDQGLCESPHVGPRSTIWAFAHVLPGAKLGEDCNICDHVFVENDVVIGDRVTVKPGVQLWDGITIGDDVFIGPNVTFTNDRFPRSKHRPPEFLRTIVEKGASLGANCTILPGLTIGRGSMIGAGAVVTRNVPPHSVVVGNPARITGYLDGDDRLNVGRAVPLAPTATPGSRVRGVRRHLLTEAEDIRGRLAAAQIGQELPFVPKRMFSVYGVPSTEVRGAHAHRTCAQFLMCVAGQVHVHVDDGVAREDYVLDSPAVGLFIEPAVWAVQYRYSPDAVLVVLASDPYDPDDYIRDYDEFLAFVDTLPVLSPDWVDE